MVALVNLSNKYPAFGFEHKLLVGNPYFIVIAKQSFALKDNGRLKELNEQIDIRLHDIVKENVRWDSVKYPSDLIPYKPNPEIILNGTAQNNSAKKQWVCSIDLKQIALNDQLKSWSKQILVTGTRNWQKTELGQWQLSDIEETNNVRISYEKAYGGHYKLTQATDEIIDINYPLNPAGCGWLPDKRNLNTLNDEQQIALNDQLESLDNIAAPQIFAIDKKSKKTLDDLKTPYDSVPVAGFGSYANFWQMRTQYLSENLDWSEQSTDGGYPVDFDMRHWQQAPADQWLDFDIQGGEVLTLTGFFSKGKQSYILPSSIGYVVIKDPKQLAMKLDMSIDTLIIDTEHRTLEIVWRRIVSLTEISNNSIIESNIILTKK